MASIVHALSVSTTEAHAMVEASRWGLGCSPAPPRIPFAPPLCPPCCCLKAPLDSAFNVTCYREPLMRLCGGGGASRWALLGRSLEALAGSAGGSAQPGLSDASASEAPALLGGGASAGQVGSAGALLQPAQPVHMQLLLRPVPRAIASATQLLQQLPVPQQQQLPAPQQQLQLPAPQ